MGCIKCGLQGVSVPLQFHGVGKNSDLIFYPKTPKQLLTYSPEYRLSLKAPTKKYVVEVCNRQNYSCVDKLIKEGKINVLPGRIDTMNNPDLPICPLCDPKTRDQPELVVSEKGICYNCDRPADFPVPFYARSFDDKFHYQLFLCKDCFPSYDFISSRIWDYYIGENRHNFDKDCPLCTKPWDSYYG